MILNVDDRKSANVEGDRLLVVAIGKVKVMENVKIRELKAIVTAHHTFLESRHLEVTKNL